MTPSSSVIVRLTVAEALDPAFEGLAVGSIVQVESFGSTINAPYNPSGSCSRGSEGSRLIDPSSIGMPVVCPVIVPAYHV